ncbi:N-(5'-phosphoribosyl)anthranilate isomerase [Rhodospirillales bacterium TMPK1]|uniref:N-(5'-phosphoribosyl)anthranilate isomerase n=2 Tax=Roseiterribacter gracilis TaxID=2812848 RepID=A0A8S8XFT9_9PROT|nr:N-(5'-phosphoribosyl)anthranilate isomerase [Rhodospirillales bacterium TMPK1]
MIQAKICGVRTPDAIAAAVAGGARAIGLVFFPASPRAVDPSFAAELARQVPTGVQVIGLFVDPQNDDLERIVGQVPLDMVQLHGSETPERVADVKSRFGLPVMKAIAIGDAADLERARSFELVADRLLFDAKAPAGVSSLPGGNGLAFDWTLLAGQRWSRPWMLAGGLNPDNVAAAVRASGAQAVDVSSGVEDRPGHKSPAKISAFLAALRSL